MQKAALLFPKNNLGNCAETELLDTPPVSISPHPRHRGSRGAKAPDNAPVGVSPLALERLSEEWLTDCAIRNHSSTTIALRRTLCQNLVWFLADREFTVCEKSELRHFVAYLINGHNDPRGRWGKGDKKSAKPLAAATVKMYFTHLATFFTWLVIEEYTEESPMSKLTIPQARPDQVQPYTEDQVEALLTAAKSTSNPKRDYALVLTFLDTGIRSTELCTLKTADLDLMEGTESWSSGRRRLHCVLKLKCSPAMTC